MIYVLIILMNLTKYIETPFTSFEWLSLATFFIMVRHLEVYLI